MELALEGQAALITGAGRGIGAGIASGMAEAGCDVALVDLGEFAAAEALAAAIRTTGRRAVALRADVTDIGEADRAVAAARAALGRLDHLVCNAGITRD